jgi:hypothetical protein
LDRRVSSFLIDEWLPIALPHAARRELVEEQCCQMLGLFQLPWCGAQAIQERVGLGHPFKNRVHFGNVRPYGANPINGKRHALCGHGTVLARYERADSSVDLVDVLQDGIHALSGNPPGRLPKWGEDLFDRVSPIGDIWFLNYPRGALKGVGQTQYLLDLAAVVAVLFKVENDRAELGQQLTGLDPKIFVRIPRHASGCLWPNDP